MNPHPCLVVKPALGVAGHPQSPVARDQPSSVLVASNDVDFLSSDIVPSVFQHRSLRTGTSRGKTFESPRPARHRPLSASLSDPNATVARRTMVGTHIGNVSIARDGAVGALQGALSSSSSVMGSVGANIPPTVFLLEKVFTPLLAEVAHLDQTLHLSTYERFLDVHGTLDSVKVHSWDEVQENKRFVIYFMDFIMEFNGLTDHRKLYPGSIFAIAASYLDSLSAQQLARRLASFRGSLETFRAVSLEDWRHVNILWRHWAFVMEQLLQGRRRTCSQERK